MSFDKAVIKRFNEASSCAPPSTKYDPKLPHGSAKDILFGKYSGRKEQCPTKDVFITPAKPGRGRPQFTGSASVRSCSDNRLKQTTRYRSASTKSLQEIPVTPSLQIVVGQTSTEAESREAELSVMKCQAEKCEAEIESLTTELNEKRQKIALLEQQMDTIIRSKEAELEFSTNTLNTLNEAKRELETQYETIYNEAEELKRRAESDASMILTLNTELLTEREKLEKMQSVVEEEKFNLASQNEEMGRKLDEIMTSYQQLNELHAAQAHQNQQLQNENNVLIARFEDERKSHENAIAKLLSEKERLQIDCEEMSNKLEEKENFLTNIQSHIAELQTQIQLSESEKEEKIEKIKSMEAELGALLIKVAEKEGFVEQLQAQITDLQFQINLSETKKEEAEANVKSLEAKLECEGMKISDLQSHFAEERTQLGQTVESLNQNLFEIKHTYDELVDQHNNLSSQLQDAKNEAENYSNTIHSLNRQLEEKQHKILQFESQIEEEKTKTEEAIRALKDTLADLQAAKDEIHLEYESISDELQLLKTKSENDASMIITLNTDLLSEREKLEKMQSVVEEEKFILTSQKEEMDRKLAEIMISYEQLNELHAAQTHQNQQIQNENNVLIARSEDERKSHEDAIANLLSEKQRLQTDCEEKNKKLEEKESLLTDIQSQIAELETQIQLSQSEKEEKIEKIKSMEAELGGLQIKVAEKEEFVKQLQTQITDLQGQINLSETQKEEAEDEVKLLKTKLECERMKISELQSHFAEERTQLGQTVESLNQNLFEIKHTYDELMDQHNNLSSQLQDAKNEAENYSNTIHSLNRQLEEKQHKILQFESQIEEEKTRTGEEIRAMKKTLTDLQAAKDEIHLEYESMSDKLQCLKTQSEIDASNMKALNKDLRNEREKRLELQSVFENEKLHITAKLEKTENQLAEIKSSYGKHEDEFNAKMQNLVLENMALKENLDQYKSVYGDYANLASHQNSRQKIKHLINIKDENIKLRDENSMLRQKLGELKDKLRHVPVANDKGRRFDPSQAFKPVLKEPFIRDERDVRGPDARSTFTVPKKPNPKPTVTLVDNSKKESKQGLAFDITFSENKEN